MAEKFNLNKCSTCGREFALRNSLRVHELSHKQADKPHLCSFCGRQFTLQSSLKTHMLGHVDKSTFECTYCGELFSMKNDFLKHVNTHIKDETKNVSSTQPLSDISDAQKSSRNKVSCSICLKTFSNEGRLKSHMVKHNDKKVHACLLCNRKFASEEKAKQHIEKKEYSCALCARFFESCVALEDHLTVHSHECLVCGEKFKYRKDLKKHSSQHGGELHCTICSVMCPTQWKLMRHIQRVHTKEPEVQCDTCGKMYSKEYLKSHMKWHTGERNYQCKICDATFIQKGHLTTHLKSHSGIKEHKCTTCGKEFSLKSALTYHLRIHTGERPYKCEHCGKSFIQMASLTQHKEVHFPTGPHCCQLCDKKYAYKYTLNAHYRGHKKEELEKLDSATFNSIWSRCRIKENPVNWLCEVCNKSFKVKAHYFMHMKIHTGEKPYSCPLCPKTFRLKANLKTHQRTHTGERPYVCRTCGKSFVQQSHLKAHLVLHTGGKPFVCKVCGRSFGYKNNLIAHRKIHLRDLDCNEANQKPSKMIVCSTCRILFPTKRKYDNHLKYCPDVVEKFADRDGFSEDSLHSDIYCDTQDLFTQSVKEDIAEIKFTQNIKEEMPELNFVVPSIVCSTDVPLDQDEKSQLVLSVNESSSVDEKVDIVIHDPPEANLENTIAIMKLP